MDENCAIAFFVANNCSSAAAFTLALKTNSFFVKVTAKVYFEVPGNDLCQCIGKFTLRNFLFGCRIMAMLFFFEKFINLSVLQAFLKTWTVGNFTYFKKAKHTFS